MRRKIYLSSIAIMLSLIVCGGAWAAPFAYITSDDNVSVIDTATNTVIGAISTGGQTIGVAVTGAALGVDIPYISNQLSVMTGMVLYNGAPVTNYTNKSVTFWARDEGTGQSFPISPEYNSTNSTYSIPNMPSGKYGIQVYIDDAEPFDSNYFPGDYYGWNSPIEVPEGQAVVNKDLACQKLIHLTSPVDNLSEIGSIGAYPLYYQNAMVFEWDAIAEASIYQISINKYQSSPYQYIGNVYFGEVQNAQLPITLDESLENQHYEFSLYSKNATGLYIGQLMVVYDNGYGWDYRFRIAVSATGPDLTGEWLSPSQICKKGKCKVTLTLKVENIGNRDSSSTSVRIYVSEDDTFDAGDNFLKELSIKNMVAGGSWSKKVKVTVPEGQTKYVIAVIDPENSLAETEENNNQIVYGPIP